MPASRNIDWNDFPPPCFLTEVSVPAAELVSGVSAAKCKSREVTTERRQLLGRGLGLSIRLGWCFLQEPGGVFCVDVQVSVHREVLLPPLQTGWTVSVLTSHEVAFPRPAYSHMMLLLLHAQLCSGEVLEKLCTNTPSKQTVSLMVFVRSFVPL